MYPWPSESESCVVVHSKQQLGLVVLVLDIL